MSTVTETEAVAAMAGEPRRHHPVSEDCWKVLDALRDGMWSATALRLNGLGMLSYRGRISDLRIKHGLEIVADSHRDADKGKLHTTYRVPEHARARATHLWRFRSLAGYEETQRQGGLF